MLSCFMEFTFPSLENSLGFSSCIQYILSTVYSHEAGGIYYVFILDKISTKQMRSMSLLYFS